MKFLHTADWQVGMMASSFGSAGDRIREERVATGRRVVEIARNHGAQFILVAGDLFEDNAVDRLLVQKTADILDSFGGPVYIIPGNHDALTPGSVWEHPVWKGARNLYVLREEKPVELPNGLLFPCPLFERNSGRDPTAWIPADRTGDIRIGLAHGTVENVRLDEPDYPIPRAAAQRAGLDYLALGHWHSVANYVGSDGAVRMAYSGTHETTRFGERDSGNILIVDIPNAIEPPKIMPIRSGKLEWATFNKELGEPGDLERVRAQIESMQSPDIHLLAVSLSGLFMADERAELAHIEQILGSRFLWGALDASQLRPSPRDDSWIKNLPPGIIREAASRLRDRTDVAPEVLSRALAELYAILGEVSQ